ncbi:hypothetical protein SAY86_031674 [Trapa natans]|uniref:RBR-type E3 ubiquitin transferase n=1 Tax=Trapa natans TaxID=22666 RepID=A0AAN7LRR0_TRANT|nr:hypothetical protein SAY86_031674 [Trapa natans]
MNLYNQDRSKKKKKLKVAVTETQSHSRKVERPIDLCTQGESKKKKKLKATTETQSHSHKTKTSMLKLPTATSSSNWDQCVDKAYFSLLFDDEEIFPISDEKYAHKLALQEALLFGSSWPSNSSSCSTHKYEVEHQDSLTLVSDAKGKAIKCIGEPSARVQEAPPLPLAFCMICMEMKSLPEMLRIGTTCSHSFCADCIGKYICTKIGDNIVNIKCPDMSCQGTLDMTVACRDLVPKEVFDRWEEALCESVILGSQRVYCPYKDCSAFVVDDSLADGEAVTSCECPICHRLFCAQCGVPWHCGLICQEFKAGKVGGVELDEMARAFAKSKNWMSCPKCKFFVEKTQGCNHITCRCKFQFCYGCGRAWSSDHICPI